RPDRAAISQGGRAGQRRSHSRCVSRGTQELTEPQRPSAKDMKKRNVFYAQSGGVTAVINASAAGVIETARNQRERIGKVYAGRNGIIGALTEDLIDTSRESVRAIAALKHTPGGAFGSARYKLASPEK